MKTLFKNNISKDKKGKKKILLFGKQLNFKEEIKPKIKFPIYKKRKIDFINFTNI